MNNELSQITINLLKFLKNRWWIFIIIFFSFKGVQGYWKDFKEYIVSTELKTKGINIKEENQIFVETSIDTNIVLLENDLKKNDYQKTKINIAKRIKHEKSIIIDTADIRNDKIILSKWKNRKH